MAGLGKDTIGGFNESIASQSKIAGQTMLTTVLFDHECEVLWNGIDAKGAKLTDIDVRGYFFYEH